MRISPSGKRKISIAQKDATKSTSNMNDLESRPNIEQEEFSFGQDEPLIRPYNPFANFSADMNKPKTLPEVSKTVDSKIDANEATSQDDADGDMEDAYFSLLKKMGIQLKIGDAEKKNQLFSINVDVMGGGTSNGFFIIPEYIDSERINQNKAQNIAKDFATKFNATKLTYQKVKGNYKFNFVIAPKDGEQMTNSSLDEILGANKKAEFSQNGFIKESKNNIINSLMKKGFGGNHAS